MKTLRTLLVITIVTFGFAGVSFGQTKTVTVAATADVVKTLTIEKTTDLSFGTFGALADGPSTVVLGLDNSRTSSTADLVGNDGASGVFKITGEPKAAVSITAPGAISLVGPDGSTPMTIAADAWTYDVTLGNVTLPDVTGVKEFKVGATLQLKANQEAGHYSGNYTLTVNYN